jgi:hypothetical protein
MIGRPALSELLKQHSEQTTPLDGDERWALVQRVASSHHLAKAPQLREILVYVSVRVLADHATAISEQEIGRKVLGRRPDFSPNEDNIVRVQIRHLRKKLEDYFSLDGAAEPLVLTIPKGSYLPHFEPRAEHPAPEAMAAPAEIPTPAVAIPEAGSTPLKTGRAWRAAALVGLLLAAAASTALIWWKHPAASRAPSTTEDAQPAHEDPLWSRLFSPRRQTSIVVADSNLVVVQDILNADIPLSDYLKGGYPEKLIGSIPNRELQAALRLISAREYTSLGDANLAARFMDLGRRYGAQTNLRYSRYVSVREFKTGNFVLVGSRRGIPWEQLFESGLNFNLEEDRATRRYHLRNKSPLPGERPVYEVSRGGGANENTYADVALLPNLTRTGYVLILAGIDMAATEAAGEFVTNSDFGASLTKLLSSRAGQPPASYIEILLEAKATAGSGGGARIVGYRLIEGPRPAGA